MRFFESSAERRQRIDEKKEQLYKLKTPNLVETLNSQTQRNSSSEMTDTKKMVAPGSKDAPRFKSTKPEELRRFIRLMEDLWKEAGVEDDEKKKLMIGKYADQESEEEWAAFRSFEKGNSWKEFKKELIENYPEAAAAERGTPARLRQLCAETSRIRLGDMPSLYAFRRAFLAEAKKLLKPPEAMANRELVELFIGCLTESMASAVLQFLGTSMANSKPKDKDASSDKDATADKETDVKERRPEDKYDLEDVCKAAILVSENSQGMYNLMKKESASNKEERGVFLYQPAVSEAKALTDKIEELEGVQALEKDRLVSMTKTMESKIGGIEDLIKKLMTQSQPSDSKGGCKGDCKGNGCKTHESSGNTMQKWGKSMENEKCFYCGRMGHFQGDCDDLKEQIRIGHLKVNPEGRLRLRDGSLIPGYPHGASIKERVEKHYSKRPSQFHYGACDDEDLTGPMVPAYPAQLLHVDDAEKRRVRLEKELDLLEKEEALELRRLKLEREEKKLEKSSGGSRSTNLVDLLGQLTDDEMAAIIAARSGSSFQ